MESKFTGGLLGLIGVNLLSSLLIAVTFGIALPWAICIKHRWVAKHTIIDGNQMYFDGSGAQLIGNWIKWLLLTIITFGIYGFWVSLKLKNWVTKHTHMIANQDQFNI